MAEMLGFWSYAHADDDLDSGRVLLLGKDIVGHYEAITAEGIEFFQDRDDLHWGDVWRNVVDGTLANVAFFMPVLTPRYFRSVECKRELRSFLERADRLGLSRLVLPILYIDVPKLHEDEPADELVQRIKKIQWTDWTSLRFEERTSAAYRREVYKLAEELARRVAELEKVDLSASQPKAPGDEEDDSPGILERLEALEQAMPRWAETIEKISQQIVEIGEVVKRGGEDMQKGPSSGKGEFATRITVARRVARELATPVDEIERLSSSFVSDLTFIDDGTRVLLAAVAEDTSLRENPTPDLCRFLGGLRTLSESSHGGLTMIESMVDSTAGVENMSRDLRTPLRRLRIALTSMQEARLITDQWAELVDFLNIDCTANAR